MTKQTALTRRATLGLGLAGLGAMMFPMPALAAGRGSFGLMMTNGNTDERFRHTLIADGKWVREALAEFDWFARDWRENSDYPIDTESILMLMKLQQLMDTSEPMILLSGYRTPATNSKLRGAATDSLHLRGMALDITQPGRDLRDLHRAAVSMRRGGVGYYPRNHFVHIDTGRLRHWTG